MKYLRRLLLPFSFIYGFITIIRNKLFDWKILKSQQFSIPVIVVGNLSTGGTGKSPMIEYLIRLLKDRYKVGVVSRGYRRKTKGFIEVNTSHFASEVGDEPLQFKKKFPEVTVAVSEKRAEGIHQIEKDVDVVLLDDAFQHRYVTPDFSILLTSYGDLFVHDFILPAGNLRESRSGASRADVIVVTKCPSDLSQQEKETISKQFLLKPSQQLFFSTISYGNEMKSEKATQPLDRLQNQNFLLVTGIANPEPLVQFLKARNLRFLHKAFPDHHHFSASEIETLETHPLILTTEKDYVRLQPSLKSANLFYLPIAVSFLENEDGFKVKIMEVTSKKGE